MANVRFGARAEAEIGLAESLESPSERGISDGSSAKAGREPYALKRPLDLLLSSIGLVLTAPLVAIIAVAIKLEDGGPIIYSQERWGREGRPFRLLKFRTMVSSANADLGIVQAAPRDERISTVGRVLRAAGLDELPQLVNVLRGDMSIVGPRALALAEVVNVSGQLVHYDRLPGFAERMHVRPGITSPATVYMHKDVEPTVKFSDDIAYVRQQTLWLDLRLIAISLWVSLRGKWEVRESKL
jgi:lipopolysaccharide/colanic/teichoic acid biosynthesis glycosyltransferase